MRNSHDDHQLSPGIRQSKQVHISRHKPRHKSKYKADRATASLNQSIIYKNIHKITLPFCLKKKHFDILFGLKNENMLMWVENCLERVPIAMCNQ
jgi:hypothetical protein